LIANKQDLEKHWGKKIAIATTKFIMTQIFKMGLIPEIKNEMLKKSRLSLSDTVIKAEELENL
jgi:hypothetical protein